MIRRAALTVSFLFLVLLTNSVLTHGAGGAGGDATLPASAVLLARGGGPTTEPTENDDPVVEVHLVHQSGKIDRYPLADIVPTPTPTGAPAPTEPSSTAFLTPTKEFAEWPTATVTNEPGDQPCYANVISARGSNVRDEPALSGRKLGALPKGTRLRIYSIKIVAPEGAPLREEWGAIEYDSRLAYIALWYAGEELAHLDETQYCWIIAGGKG